MPVARNSRRSKPNGNILCGVDTENLIVPKGLLYGAGLDEREPMTVAGVWAGVKIELYVAIALLTDYPDAGYWT